MKNLRRTPWLRMAFPPILLAAAMFGSSLFDATLGVVSEAKATIASLEVQPRHRYIPDNLFGVDFFDEKHGIATGYFGTVLRTEDGGRNWNWHTTGETELLRRVHMTSIEQAFSIGHRGTIYRTQDKGASWQVVHREPDTMLRAVAFSPDGIKGWAVGNRAAILRTRDGGQTWERQALTGYTARDLPTWNGVALVDSDSGSTTVALVGEFGILAFSSDEGESWVIRKSPTGTTLNDIAVTPGGFLAVGLDGTAVKITHLKNATEDSYELKALSTGSTEHLFSLAVDAGGEGVVVGKSSVLQLSGDHFNLAPVDDEVGLPYTWFADIDMTDGGAFWTVGRGGVIAGSPPGGGALQVMFRLGSGVSTQDTINLKDQKL